MKGIILAGGTGSRLFPLTAACSKQLLPVYDKPMIYYPLSVLMLAGIRDILIITSPNDESRMRYIFGESRFGVKFSYAVQNEPRGIAESFIIARDFIGEQNVCLILGDNIFFGVDFEKDLMYSTNLELGAIIFGYKVHDPERYGVVMFDDKMRARKIIEKPKLYISNYAVPGLYFYDNSVIAKALTLHPSYRGELEITDIHNLYISENKLEVRLLPDGMSWFDAGTFDSLIEAGQYVQIMQKRQDIRIGCPEEVALRKKWVTK